MKKQVALYDQHDRFVLVASMKEALDYFDNVLQIGTMFWANGFTDHELKTIPLEQLFTLSEKRKAQP
jgi:hypothetical protein